MNGDVMRLLVRRPVTLAGAALLGLGVSNVWDTAGFVASPAYLTSAAILLGIGLIGSTRDIMFSDLRDRLGTVISAVTLGVLAKAALIIAVMYAFTGSTAVLFGLAVAQIDPLAVAAMNQGSRLSRRARAILGAWASFDDPVTVLLTIYATGFVLGHTGGTRPVSFGTTGEQLRGFLVDLGRNAALVVAAWLLWKLLCRIRTSTSSDRGRRVVDVIGLVLLVAIIVVSAWMFLMLGLALVGLFFRPPVGRILTAGSETAFHIAVFGLGLLLVEGVDFKLGLLLALAAVGAHAIVSVPISWGLPSRDRHYLAAGQQNGMTAVVLALVLDRDFAGVVGVVAPAVLIIAVIHTTWNALLDRFSSPVLAPILVAHPPKPERETRAEASELDTAELQRLVGGVNLAYENRRRQR
jgi:NhaP-type Na+/H+ or K+/H+ antiporter